MSASATLLLLCTVAFLALAILVHLKGRSTLSQKLFGGFCWASAVWSAAILLVVLGVHGELSGRLAFTAAAVSTALILLFLMSSTRAPLSRWHALWALPGAAVAVAALFGLVVERPIFDAAGQVKTYAYGPAAGAYAIVEVLYALAVIFVMVRRLVYTRDKLARAQLVLPTFAIIVTTVVLVVMVLLYPLVLGRRVAPFGLANLSLLLVAMAFAYSIIRHRYLDVGVLARGFLVHLLVILILTPCTAAIFLSVGIYDDVSGWRLTSNALLVALVTVVLFPPLRSVMETLVDRWIFKTRYHYQRDIKRFIGELSDLPLMSPVEIETLVGSRLDALMGEGSVTLHTLGEHVFRPVSAEDGDRPLGGTRGRELAELLQRYDALIAEELERTEPDVYDRLSPIFDQLGAAALLRLNSRHALIGFLALGGERSRGVYSAQDVDFLLTIAGQTAAAVDNARLFEQVLVAKHYTESVLQQMTSGLVVVDLDLTVRTINHHAERLLGVEHATIIGKPADRLPPEAFEFLQRAVQEDRYERDFEVELTPLGKEATTQLARVSTSPHVERGTHVGVLMLINDVSEVAALRETALTDRLTGIPNRRAFEERIKEDHERLRRHETPCTIGVVDVDHFKHFNDNFGHVAGDQVLRMLANHLAHATRTTDFVARYGGEEFVVVFSGMDAQNAELAAERIRQELEEQSFVYEGRAHRITASIGVAELRPEAESWAVAFKEADRALYRAKAEGRNRVQLMVG